MNNKLLNVAIFVVGVTAGAFASMQHFKVKYNIPKTVCKSSGRYKIYAQPSDLSGQIERAEALLSELRQRQSDSVALSDSSTSTSSMENGGNNQATQSPTVTQEEVQSPPPAQETCFLNTNILGLIPVRIACSTR